MIHNAIVPVSSRALARTTTPSRRRRIIYESARRLTREYLSNAIYNIESSTKAARLIQHVWRTYVHRIQRQDAVNQIHRFYKIAQAKKERCTRRKQKQHRASAVIANFCRRRHEFYLSTSAILIQKSWRGAIARMIAQEAKLTLLELECSAIVIQSFVRTYIARKAFERRHYPPCALLIQRKFRLYLSRKRRKQKMLVNECSRILQHWWRNMMIVIRMLKFAEEERRLRLLLVDEEPTEDDMDLSDAIQSDPVDNESTNNEENEIDSCAGGDSNSQDETINSSAKLEDDSQSTKSSNISFEVSNATEMSICENDDLSISSVKSTQKSSTVDHINEGMRKAMELEHKRNQSAILLQTQIRLFIIKRRRDEHIRKLKEKFAANTLTKQFWIVYQVFIARRERRKRDLECRAVIVIQTSIRSFLATRFVSKIIIFFFSSSTSFHLALYIAYNE